MLLLWTVDEGVSVAAPKCLLSSRIGVVPLILPNALMLFISVFKSDDDDPPSIFIALQMDSMLANFSTGAWGEVVKGPGNEAGWLALIDSSSTVIGNDLTCCCECFRRRFTIFSCLPVDAKAGTPSTLLCFIRRRLAFGFWAGRVPAPPSPFNNPFSSPPSPPTCEMVFV